MKLRLLTESAWASEARRRHGCRRQRVVALSSGEAEVCSGVCGLTKLIGVSNDLKEMRGECWGDRMEHPVRASQFYFAVVQGLSISIQSGCGSKRSSRGRGSVY